MIPAFEPSKSAIAKILAEAEHFPLWMRLAQGSLGVLFIGFCDYITGPELSSSIFYFLPIFYVAWLDGARAGLLIAILSTAIWLSADVAHRPDQVLTVIIFWNTLVRLGLFLIVNYIVAALHSSHLHEQTLARFDGLTGLANARWFFESAERELERSRRYSLPLSLAYIDIDNFKSINDRLGHKTGDEVLASVGTVIAESVRKIDLAGRLGGDEFAILIIESDKTETINALERMKADLSKLAESNDWPISFSIGIACFERGPEDVDQMVGKADDLMYRGKKSGKNQIFAESFGEPAGLTKETVET